MNNRQITSFVVETIHDWLDVDAFSFVVICQPGSQSATLRIGVDMWIDPGATSERSMYLVGGQIGSTDAVGQENTILAGMQVVSTARGWSEDPKNSIKHNKLIYDLCFNYTNLGEALARAFPGLPMYWERFMLSRLRRYNLELCVSLLCSRKPGNKTGCCQLAEADDMLASTDSLFADDQTNVTCVWRMILDWMDSKQFQNTSKSNPPPQNDGKW